jgi:hypothetical protein
MEISFVKIKNIHINFPSLIVTLIFLYIKLFYKNNQNVLEFCLALSFKVLGLIYKTLIYKMFLLRH